MKDNVVLHYTFTSVGQVEMVRWIENISVGVGCGSTTLGLEKQGG